MMNSEILVSEQSLTTLLGLSRSQVNHYKLFVRANLSYLTEKTLDLVAEIKRLGNEVSSADRKEAKEWIEQSYLLLKANLLVILTEFLKIIESLMQTM